MRKFLLGEKSYQLHPLSALEAAECIREAEALGKRLSLPDGSGDLAGALGEYGALCAACLYDDGARAFKTPEAALARLTLDELCNVWDAYRDMEADEVGREPDEAL